MSLYYVSDIHLKSNNERNAFLFVEFLKQLQRSATPEKNELYLLGDIFDLWVSDHEVFVDRFDPIIQEMQRVRQSGTPIYFFEGNHDVHIDVFFQKELGMQVFDQGHTFQRHGIKIRCEHGDYINPEDVIYHQYLKVIRHPHVERMGHWVPGFVWDISGRWGSQFSRKKSRQRVFRNPHHLRELILQYTRTLVESEEFDVLVTGHVHYRMEETVSSHGRTVRTINLGSWFEEPQVLQMDIDGSSQIKTSWLSYADGIFKTP